MSLVLANKYRLLQYMVPTTVLCILLFKTSCITIPNQYEGIAPGNWRAVLYISEYKELIVTEGRKKDVKRDVQFEDKSIYVPFNFEIQTREDSSQYIVIRNGEERIQFGPIIIGRDIRTGDDTFYIDLSPYDACLKGIYEGNKMQGNWIVRDKPNYTMAFEARFGQQHRFHKLPRKPGATLYEKYQVVFSPETSDAYASIGEFKQMEQKVYGTFRTETGDYRYLEGELDSNRMLLSCFDGAHAYLFESYLKGDSIYGQYYSGMHYKTDFRGKMTENGKLKSSDSLSMSKSADKFQFKFQLPDGGHIDFDEPFYQGKIKIVQVMGSWCPNCLDEARFLKDYLNQNKPEDLVVVGLSFERYAEREKAMDQILRYKNKLDLPYLIAYGGRSNKDSASRVLPQLTKVAAFPTMIFIDASNHIFKVHTGFDGPATSYYDHFKKEFEETIQQMRKAK